MLLVLVLAGVMGNVLAITIETKLQNVTNYFLLSLAVADLFVCVIVMPASIANELIGKYSNVCVITIPASIANELIVRYQ